MVAERVILFIATHCGPKSKLHCVCTGFSQCCHCSIINNVIYIVYVFCTTSTKFVTNGAIGNEIDENGTKILQTKCTIGEHQANAIVGCHILIISFFVMHDDQGLGYTNFH